MANEDARTTVLQGTLDLMILQTLHALGPQHGYAIAARIEQVSKGALRLNMGTPLSGIDAIGATRSGEAPVGRHRGQPPRALLQRHRGQEGASSRPRSRDGSLVAIIRGLAGEPA